MKTTAEQMEIYPGEYRHTVSSGEVTSVFDENSLDTLSEFGLADFLTDPRQAPQLQDFLTEDKGFGGTKINGTPRAYRINSAEGNTVVIKPFSDYHKREMGFNHLTTQELLHAALQDTRGYRAARVFGHISLSATDGTSYSVMEYVDAPTLAEAKEQIADARRSTFGLSKAIAFLLRRDKPDDILPADTTYEDYEDLKWSALDTCDSAIEPFGVNIPLRNVDGYSTWDFNPGNLLCETAPDGSPRLAIIDQSVPVQ